MLLEEDLGAEVVVFLRAGATPLVTVVPYGQHGAQSDETITVGVEPPALAVFSAATGLRLGRGA